MVRGAEGGGWGTVDGGSVFEDTPRLLRILVMVGGDGGGRGRATVQMPTIRSVLEECGRWLKYGGY